MKKTHLNALLFIATLTLLSSAGASANETAEPAVSTESADSASGNEPGVVGKVEKAIVRGATAAANGVEHGAKAAARGIEHGAKAAARGVERGVKATGRAAHTVAEKVGVSSAPSSSSDK